MLEKKLFKEEIGDGLTEREILENVVNMDLQYFYIYSRHLTIEEQEILKNLLKNRNIAILYKLAWNDGVEYGYS